MYDGYESVAKQQGVSNPAAVELDARVPPSDLGPREDLRPDASNPIAADTGNLKVNINPPKLRRGLPCS